MKKIHILLMLRNRAFFARLTDHWLRGTDFIEINEYRRRQGSASFVKKAKSNRILGRSGYYAYLSKDNSINGHNISGYLKFCWLLCKISILACCTLLASGCAYSPQAKINLIEAANLNKQLGLQYLKMGEIPLAKQKLLLALRQSPNDAEIQQAVGYFYLTVGEKSLSKAYYRRSLEILPENGAVQNNYGVYLCRIGHYKDALKHFLYAAHNPNYLNTAFAYQNAGQCALKIPNKKLAAEYFKKARHYGIK